MKKIILKIFIISFIIFPFKIFAAVPVYVVGGFLHGFINKGVGTDNPVCPSRGADNKLREEGVEFITPTSGGSSGLSAPPPPPDDGGGGGGPPPPPGGGTSGAVVGMNFDEILWRFLCTFKDYQEKFTFDYLRALGQKQRVELTRSLMDEIKAFELAKIEKAREDVNKLIQETIKELKEQPIIASKIDASYGLGPISGNIVKFLRLKGISVSDRIDAFCPFGLRVSTPSGGSDCWVIKQSSRVVNNLDDYLVEEGLKKARDAVMCLLAPWNHWPAPPLVPPPEIAQNLGECKPGNTSVSNLKNCLDDFEFGKAIGLCTTDPQGSKPPYDTYPNSVINECSTSFICAYARRMAGLRPDMWDYPAWFSPSNGYYYKLCPSDRAKEDFKRELILKLIRKHKALASMPPEIWYYGWGIDPNTEAWSLPKTPDQFRTEAENFEIFPEECKDPGTSEKSQNFCFPYDPYPTRERCDFILEELLGKPGNPLTYLATAFKIPLERSSIAGFLQPRVGELLLRELKSFYPNIPLHLMVKRKHNLAIFPKEEVRALDDKNNFEELKKKIGSYISDITERVSSLNELKYTVGQGIKPLQYLIGWNACEDVNRLSQVSGGGLPSNFNRKTVCSSLRFNYGICSWDSNSDRCEGSGYYFFETEDIISPSIFLVNKIASSIKSEFELAMMAWKGEPESKGIVKLATCPEPECSQPGDFNCWERIDLDDKNLLALNLGADIRERKEGYSYCLFRIKDNLTQNQIGEIVIDPIEKKILRFPKVLPAPWEDLERYLNLKRGFGDFVDNYCSSITDQNTCERRHYLKGGGYPFCKWYPESDLAYPGKKGSLSYPGGICRYKASEVLVYDTENPDDVYRRIDDRANISDPFAMGERSPGFITGGQYFNRLYRETIQLFEKPLQYSIIDWYEPQYGKYRSIPPCMIIDRSRCNDSDNPRCVWDDFMNICRFKTCEEINRLPQSKISQACPRNPGCVLTQDPQSGDYICRKK